MVCAPCNPALRPLAAVAMEPARQPARQPGTAAIVSVQRIRRTAIRPVQVLEAQNKPREVVKRLASLGFSGACIRETAVVHEEAPEQLGIWRFVRDGKGARLAEEEEEGERDQQAGLDMADVNLPPAPSVEALTEDEGDVEEAGADHSECALWMQEVARFLAQPCQSGASLAHAASNLC
jgi:hypothetical protein